LAAAYDFFVIAFQVSKEALDFQFIPMMKTLPERARGWLASPQASIMTALVEGFMSHQTRTNRYRSPFLRCCS